MPSLVDVPCLSAQLDDCLLTILKNQIFRHGTVASRPPVQLEEFVEKPGGILVRWCKVGKISWEKIIQTSALLKSTGKAALILDSLQPSKECETLGEIFMVWLIYRQGDLVMSWLALGFLCVTLVCQALAAGLCPLPSQAERANSLLHLRLTISFPVGGKAAEIASAPASHTADGAGYRPGR